MKNTIWHCGLFPVEFDQFTDLDPENEDKKTMI